MINKIIAVFIILSTQVQLYSKKSDNNWPIKPKINFSNTLNSSIRISIGIDYGFSTRPYVFLVNEISPSKKRVITFYSELGSETGIEQYKGVINVIGVGISFRPFWLLNVEPYISIGANFDLYGFMSDKENLQWGSVPISFGVAFKMSYKIKLDLQFRKYLLNQYSDGFVSIGLCFL